MSGRNRLVISCCCDAAAIIYRIAGLPSDGA
jgi:hypothetical protein